MFTLNASKRAFSVFNFFRVFSSTSAALPRPDLSWKGSTCIGSALPSPESTVLVSKDSVNDCVMCMLVLCDCMFSILRRAPY